MYYKQSKRVQKAITSKRATFMYTWCQGALYGIKVVTHGF